MSKFSVPQELQQQIIDLYVNQQKDRKYIKKFLNLSFGDSVIKRILLENDVEVRSNPGAKKGGRKIQQVEEEVVNKIIDLYVNRGYGLDKIVRELNLPFSFDKVKSILKENNIHIRNLSEAQKVSEKKDLRKYSINDDYNLNSHNGAWLLGFIATDGYLPNTKGARNRIAIGLSRVDKEILEIIKEELEYTGPIYDYICNGTDKQYEGSSLTFNSKKIRAEIERYGIGPDKTFNLHKIPDISEEYKFDFIRGAIDGDGSIYAYNGNLNLSFTSASYDFLIDIFNYLNHNLKLSYGGSIAKDHNNLAFRFGKNDANIICSKLYDNDYLALPRKKLKFNSLRDTPPTRLDTPQG